ncbi:MAG: Holliday junction branch migration DNA helicase RuvB [Candidatus Babeliaceae bacterium]
MLFHPIEDIMETRKIVTVQELTLKAEESHHEFHPKTFDDYLGQKELKEKLSLYAQAARMRGEPLDHLLLFGPPGLGKTTLAQIIAAVMQVNIKICSGPTLERTGDLVAILSSLEPREVLFIDEIHRMPIPVEEVLYNAIEHFRVDVIIGQGAGAQSINLPINPFTLIGATTMTGLISAPLRSRFGISERLDFYTAEDLQAIVLQNARFLGLILAESAALIIAQAARGTPRIAKKILRRVRDLAQVNHHNQVTEDIVNQSLAFQGIEPNGLTAFDRQIIHTLIEKCQGGPVGLETLAALVGEKSSTLEEVYEPFLLRMGYLEIVSRGRQIPRGLLATFKKNLQGQTSLFDPTTQSTKS